MNECRGKSILIRFYCQLLTNTARDIFKALVWTWFSFITICHWEPKDGYFVILHESVFKKASKLLKTERIPNSGNIISIRVQWKHVSFIFLVRNGIQTSAFIIIVISLVRRCNFLNLRSVNEAYNNGIEQLRNIFYCNYCKL